MLKKLGYLSYLLGIIGIAFVMYILLTENNSRLEPQLILFTITILSILQLMFVTYSLQQLNNRTYKKIGAIDEYLTIGLGENQSVRQLPLGWKIIGWMVIVASIGIAMICLAVFSEYAFNTWKRFDFYALIALFTLGVAVVSTIYSIKVVNRKWIGDRKELDDL